MTDIAIVGLGKALGQHAEAWLGVVPQLWLPTGSKRLLGDESGSGGRADVMARSHVVSTDRLDAIEADRGPAITPRGRAGHAARERSHSGEGRNGRCKTCCH